MTQAPDRTKSVSLFNIQRLTFEPEALLLENRDPITGIWRAHRQVFYDEVRAVYSYRERDWGYAGVALIYAVLGSAVIGLVAATTSTSQITWVWAEALLAAALLPLTLYRALVVQKPMVSIQTVTGPVQFPMRDTTFVQRLLTRLTLVGDGSTALPATITAPTIPPAVETAGPTASVPGSDPQPPATTVDSPARWAWNPSEEKDVG